MQSIHKKFLLTGPSPQLLPGIIACIKKPIRVHQLKAKLESIVTNVQPTFVYKSDSLPNPAYTTLSILVAEDNPSNQKVILKMLSNIGCGNVKLVQNGQQMVTAVLNEDFWVVLSDIMVTTVPDVN